MFSVTPISTWPRIVIAVVLPFVLVGVLLVILLNRWLPWYGWMGLLLAVGWLGWSLVQTLLDIREIGMHQETQWNHRPPRLPRPKKVEPIEEPAGNVEQLLSLVYFLDDPRLPTVQSVRRLLESVYGISFDKASADEVGFLTRLEPEVSKGHLERYFFRTELGGFSLIACSEPYIDKPEQFAQRTIRDKRLRTAVESHSAWISIDYAESTVFLSSFRRSEIYEMIGKVASALAGPDCLAIYCPELQRCNEFDLEMIERLKEGDPRNIFDEPTHEPVIEVSEDNPLMRAAVQEAIKRWPEFVAEFEKSGKDPELADSFIVKAEFKSLEGEAMHSEFMWMTVIEVSLHQIRGRLMNEPHRLEHLHRGQEVEIDLARLNDWLCPGPKNTPIGGFTLAVLSDDGDENS